MIYLKDSKLPVTEAKSTAKILQEILDKEDLIEQEKEHFYVVHLNVKSKILMVELVGVGIVGSCIVHPRETFRRAVAVGATSIIVAHNHPSGETEPSDEDTKMTRKLFEAGEVLGIPLLDHIIFAKNNYFAFRDNGGGEIG